MNSRLSIKFVCPTLLTMIFFIPALASAQSLEGVWSVVESIRISGDDAGSLEWPGIMMFTGEHIAYSLVTTDQDRPRIGPDSSDTERLAAWGPFNAAAGTYDFDGSAISGSWLLGKNPEAEGSSFTWVVNELTEDTFSFTGGNTRYNFVRIE